MPLVSCVCLSGFGRRAFVYDYLFGREFVWSGGGKWGRGQLSWVPRASTRGEALPAAVLGRPGAAARAYDE